MLLCLNTQCNLHINVFPLSLWLAPDFRYDSLTDTWEEMPTSGVTQEYSSWLALWSEHIKSNPNTTHLPLAACKVTTPLKQDAWHLMLAAHPKQSLVKFFIEGIIVGFQLSIHFTTTSKKEHGECKLTSGRSD